MERRLTGLVLAAIVAVALGGKAGFVKRKFSLGPYFHSKLVLEQAVLSSVPLSILAQEKISPQSIVE
jgi:hypothetical protein